MICADLVLDILKDALGGFDAGLGRDSDVELDLAAVDGGEEVAADHGQHPAAERWGISAATTGTMSRRLSKSIASART